MKKNILVGILLIAISILFLPKRCIAWNSTHLGPISSTHASIAQDAINVLPSSDYPDIYIFSNRLIDGCNSEVGHQGNEFDGGNVLKWWNDNVPPSYKNGDYSSAYYHVGEVCHLTQDQAVPTHAANISHGTKLRTPPYFLVHADDLESYTAFHYLCLSHNGYSYRWPYSYYQPLQDDTRSKLSGWTKPSTGEQYWMPAVNAPPMGQDATAPGQPWGHYGGDNGTDIYGWYIPEKPEIVVDQLTQAVSYSAGVFAAASRSLPPVVRDLEIEPNAQANPVINKQTGNLISFKILENRKMTVKVFITVDATYGDPIISADYGTGKPFDLSVGTNLPWEGTYSVTWNGILANGQYPADGVHYLYGNKSA